MPWARSPVFSSCSASPRSPSPCSERVRHYREFVLTLDRRRPRRSRARAAWTAAFRSARAAARSTTSFRTGTTSSIATSGSRRSTCCTRPTTSPSSPAASARRRARRRARSTSTTIPVGIKSIEHFIIDKGWEEGWVVPLPPAREDRQARRRRRLGPGGPGVRAAARARRPRRRAVREDRPHRRPAALRHPRLQDGEAPDRPAHGADVERGRRVPAERRTSASTSTPRTLLARVRRRRADRRRRAAARPAGAGPRPRRRPFRDGVPAAAEQGRRRRHASPARSSRPASTSS